MLLEPFCLLGCEEHREVVCFDTLLASCNFLLDLDSEVYGILYA